MSEKTVRVYDPPLCCSTGVCGANVDSELVRFAADVRWLESQGVLVERFNLARQPDVFVQDPAILALLNAEDTACLPVVLVGGAVLSKGAYPSRHELAASVGLSG